MRVLILFFFFISGTCGLIYEVVWTKLLTLAMGSTVYSISTVLVAFMGGIALGSYLGGRLIDRKGDPLLMYGILEGLIGLYCLIIPGLISLSDPVFAVFYNRFYTDQYLVFSLLRFVICVIILIIPTALMGATLPILAKYYVSDREKFGWDVGRLYAINTFGAVFGSFTSGFILLPLLGQWKTILVAVCANLLIFASVACYRLFVARGAGGPSSVDNLPKGSPPVVGGDSVPEEGFSSSRALVLSVLAAYCANGFAGMTYQIAWTRALSLSLGSSTYSFSLILTTFILGLAIGSAAGARIVDRLRRPALAFGWVELAIGFMAIGVIWGLGRLPWWIVPVIAGYSKDYNILLLVQFGLVFLLILAPTFLMGTAFPLAVKVVSTGRAGVGRPVGLAYGWNTAGAIMGSFFGGFVLIPLLGLQGTINTANWINWFAGILLLVAAGAAEGRWVVWRRRLAGGALCMLGLLLTFAMPRWDTTLMDIGPFMYAREYMSGGKLNSRAENSKQLFYEEDVTTTVSVREGVDGDVFLRVNGKTDASTGGDMATQVLSGHLPLIFQENPTDVLVIGLASGVTAGSVTLYPSVERVDIVEISDGVVKACRNFFAKYNDNVLEDDRVNLIIGDGRNHLRETDRRYDAIISEPSNPWIAGISSLFTREYFQSGRDHLKPGGAMFVWFQAYGMEPDGFKAIVKTFSEVFPKMMVWEMGVPMAGDFGLLGFADSASGLDCRALKKHMMEPSVAGSLKKLGIKTPERLLSGIMLGPDASVNFSKGGRVHTDDHMFLEYEAPRSMYLETQASVLRQILLESENPLDVVQTGCLTLEDEKNTLRMANGRREFLWGLVQAEGRSAQDREAMITRFEVSYEIDPGSNRVKNRLRDELLQRAADYMKAGDYRRSTDDLRRLTRDFPEDGKAYYLLGVALYNWDPARNGPEIGGSFEAAGKLGYNSPRLYFANATFLFNEAENMQQSNPERLEILGRAASDYRRAVEMDPGYFEAWNGYGACLLRLGKYAESRAAFNEALKIRPGNPEILSKIEILKKIAQGQEGR